MFLYTTYRFNKANLLLAATIGILCYILIHSYLYSKYVDDYPTVLQFRKCIYLLFVVDVAFTGYTYYADKNKPKKKSLKAPKKKLIKAHNSPTIQRKLVNAKKKFVKKSEEIPLYKSKNAAAPTTIPVYVRKDTPRPVERVASK